MKVRVAGEIHAGRTIDLRDRSLGASAVTSAIRGDGHAIAIDCPAPGRAHEFVGTIRPGMSLRIHSALAAAARSHGRDAPQDDELATVRDRLDALEVAEIDLADARRRVADASDEETAVRERVATLQGRVQALRTADEDCEDAESELAEATRRLSEVETERIAAEQALDRARGRAQANRERRRERLRLEDRVDNLRRAARKHLAESVRGAFADARDSLPERIDSERPAPTALAVARVAALDAPVVLTSNADPFERPEAAARWLDAPVIRV